MSKLAQLAKLRAQKGSSTPTEPQNEPQPSNRASKLAALAKTRKKDDLTGSDVSPSPKGLLKLQSLRQKRLSPSVVEPVSSGDSSPMEVDSPPASPIVDTPEIAISVDVSVSLSLLVHRRHMTIGRSPEEPKAKRMRYSIITNHELPTEKVKQVEQSFAKPLPDDIVIEAQEQAFKKVGDLSLNDKNDKPPKTTKPFKKLDVATELAQSPNFKKPHRSFVVIGHVDAGKLTLMGRMLYDYGIVDARTVSKLVKDAEKAGKGSFALAWIMDQSLEERTHGVTIDICATDMETSMIKFTAIDAPGHKDFVPQMIGGVSQAELALLVVDSITGEFEAGFALDGQTKEHAILAKNLGIERICVAINKMDKENWSEVRFNSMREQLLEYLCGEDVAFEAEQIDFIPISGLTGVNVVNRGDVPELSWYKGPTLGKYLEDTALSTDIKDASELLQQDFYLSIHDCQRDKGALRVSGKVLSGVIQAGETVVVLPEEEKLQVQSLKVSGTQVDFAISGQLVEMSFKASQLSNDNGDALRNGDLVTSPLSPARLVQKLKVELHLFNLSKPLVVGQPFVLFRNNTHVPARITKIIEVKNGKKKKKMLHLSSLLDALVELEIQEGKLPCTTYANNKVLGRVVIRREGTTIGAGHIEELIE